MPPVGGVGARIGVVGQVRAIPRPTAATTAGAASVAQAAYGPGATTAGQPSGLGALVPTSSFGLAFWLRVAAVGLAIWVYSGLPE